MSYFLVITAFMSTKLTAKVGNLLSQINFDS